MNFNEILLEGVRDGKLEVVEYALKNGADVHAKNCIGQTALHLASWHGNAEIVRLLLASGADVHAKNCIGQTAFHVALLWGNSETIKILEDHIKSQEKPKLSIELTEEQLKKVKDILGEI